MHERYIIWELLQPPQLRTARAPCHDAATGRHIVRAPVMPRSCDATDTFVLEIAFSQVGAARPADAPCFFDWGANLQSAMEITFGSHPVL